jgi:hypothetical protein
MTLEVGDLGRRTAELIHVVLLSLSALGVPRVAAGFLATCRDQLIEEGFTREEAMELLKSLGTHK